jgi:hypothetical protein
MPKDIAVVSYNLDPKSSLTMEAVVVRDALNKEGYSAQLLHQWVFNEPDTTNFKAASYWERHDGVVICGFYNAWTLRELVRSARPVMCLNAGYVDDLGLGEREQEHVSEDDFLVIDDAHPITAGAGVALGPINIGNPVFVDSVSTQNHHVDVLLRSLGGHAVLVAHKTEPLSYFGWYRMSQASTGGQLSTLLLQTAKWTFSGP